MASSLRSKYLKLIATNIRKHGHHVYVVEGGNLPRFLYTIGLTESSGAELVLAGGYFYEDDDALEIVAAGAAAVTKRPDQRTFTLKGHGTFSLGDVHASWRTRLLLGAHDYYQDRAVTALQIVPSKTNHTIDVPDLATAWREDEQPIWRWLEAPWEYSCPSGSTTVTNLKALRGAAITELTRWETDEWEMFAGAGPDVPQEDMRVVPLAMMLAHDPTLAAATEVKRGEGLWRDGPTTAWTEWKSKRS